MTQDESRIINSNLPDDLKVAILRRLGEAASLESGIQHALSALHCAMRKLNSSGLLVKEGEFTVLEQPLKVDQPAPGYVRFLLPDLLDLFPPPASPENAAES